MIKYKLTLTVEEDAKRSFRVTGECRNQDEAESDIAFDLCRAVCATMQSPPTAVGLFHARDGGTSQLAGLMRLISHYWTGESDYEDCIQIRVDIDKLCDGDEDKKATALLMARVCHLEVFNSRATGEP